MHETVQNLENADINKTVEELKKKLNMEEDTKVRMTTEYDT